MKIEKDSRMSLNWMKRRNILIFMWLITPNLPALLLRRYIVMWKWDCAPSSHFSLFARSHVWTVDTPCSVSECGLQIQSLPVWIVKAYVRFQYQYPFSICKFENEMALILYDLILFYFVIEKSVSCIKWFCWILNWVTMPVKRFSCLDNCTFFCEWFHSSILTSTGVYFLITLAVLVSFCH